MENFRRTLWIHISVAAGGIAVFMAVIGWLAGDVAAQADRIEKDRVLLRERSAAIAALADLKSRASQAAFYEQKLNAFLPNQEQLLDFPRTLDNLARIRKVSLTFAFQGGQTASQGGMPGAVGFVLNISGALPDILGFLDDVETEPPRFLATFDSFDLTESGGSYRLLAPGRVFFK